MASLFRSQDMSLCQVFLQTESAYHSLSNLGEIGVVQFRDLNPDTNALSRRFVNEVRRCDDMERRLYYIRAELIHENVEIPSGTDENPHAPLPREMYDLEAIIERDESEIKELAENSSALQRNYAELLEYKYALENSDETLHPEVSFTDEPNVGPLDFVVGLIPREKFQPFEKMLYRVSRGNVFVRQYEIDHVFKDPRNEVHKVVFVLFFQGEQLRLRVKKICDGFRATLYPCPHDPEERNRTLESVKTRLADLTTVLNQTTDHRNVIMQNIARNMVKWCIMVKKMKAIYHMLNMFDMDLTNKCMVGECWAPTVDIPKVQTALDEASTSVNSLVKSFMQVISTTDDPPTFMRTNKFTKGFQNLIDSYGVANYAEVNPALYTIITFPFLFGVMFGDIGHGLLVFLFGAWMVIWEKPLSKWRIGEIWTIFFGGRYIIFLMGIFSMYAGLLYNDLFGKYMNLFGSSWFVNRDLDEVVTGPPLVGLDPYNETTSRVYYVGVDPVWLLADNKIIFQNSLKMKLSIIIGVIHMMFGICMQIPNHIRLGRKWNIITDFIPQIIFLTSLFGYMVFMIFFKWLAYSATNEDFEKGTRCAPSVLIYFIDMMLLRGSEPQEDCTEPYMFDFQGDLQSYLILVGLLMIPWLLLGKIILVWVKNKSGEHHTYGHPGEPMSEVVIYQMIHTIEFVLNCVSHTASYLRLWALSLAHSQLSEVAWGQMMTIGLGISSPYIGPIAIYIVFYIWAGITVVILCTMEGLSAFLHCLRLHWVEFMSKFYDGKGYAFEPFTFYRSDEEEEEEVPMPKKIN